MKAYEFDWQPFFERLQTWNEISVTSRSAYLSLRSGEAVPPDKFGTDLDRLLAGRWLTLYTDGQRVRIHDQARWLAATLRLMHRHPLQPGSESGFLAYLHDVFSRQEQRALASHDIGGRSTLPVQAASEQWLRSFLAEDAACWIRELLHYSETRPTQPALSAAQFLVREAMTWREPAAIHELPTRLPSAPPPQLSAAVRLAIRLLVLFPRLRLDNLTAEIGLWPGLSARLHRPKAAPPSAIEPREKLQLAYRIEDMTTLLVAVAGESIRVRANDYGLFAKAEQQISKNLVPLPAWLDGLTPLLRQRRLAEALALLRDTGIIAHAGRAGRDLRITPTVAADEWLADTDEGRIRRVARHLKCAENPPLLKHYYEYRNPRFLQLELPRRAVEAFGNTVPGQFVAWDEFLRWHAEGANPLLEKARQDGYESLRRLLWYTTLSPEELERQWSRILRAYLQDYLLPLAGAELAVAQDDRLCFRLTDAGRYILGLADDFSYRPEKSAGGEIVVQPNFEIVFLSPSALAEATLARFAERLPSAARGGRGIGALFKITRAAIYTAAASGATAAQALTTLRDISAKPLPANVQREIEGWFGQCRSVTVKHAVLIRCPDADTAARVVSAGGRKAQLLTDTIVELQNPKDQSALIKKLRAAGIFIQPKGKPS